MNVGNTREMDADQRTVEAARKLVVELSDVYIECIREVWGNTNAAVLKHWRDEARASLAALERMGQDSAQQALASPCHQADGRDSSIARAAEKVAAFGWGTSVSESAHFERIAAMDELRAALRNQPIQSGGEPK